VTYTVDLGSPAGSGERDDVGTAFMWVARSSSLPAPSPTHAHGCLTAPPPSTRKEAQAAVPARPPRPHRGPRVTRVRVDRRRVRFGRAVGALQRVRHHLRTDGRCDFDAVVEVLAGQHDDLAAAGAQAGGAFAAGVQLTADATRRVTPEYCNGAGAAAGSLCEPTVSATCSGRNSGKAPPRRRRRYVACAGRAATPRSKAPRVVAPAPRSCRPRRRSTPPRPAAR
jgi:hypothetical protein